MPEATKQLPGFDEGLFWRALFWAPALPGLPWFAVNFYVADLPVLGIAEGFTYFYPAVGYGAALLCGLLHWPFRKLGWHGYQAYLVAGGAAGAVTFMGAEAAVVARFIVLAGLTGLNFWWIAYKGLTLGHRIANGFWAAALGFGLLAAMLVSCFIHLACESGEFACEGY